MKVSDMTALVDELIGILKHNIAMRKKAKSFGYLGPCPVDYRGWLCRIKDTRDKLHGFNEEKLSNQNQEKLETACEYFCLAHLIHGAEDDELYLCKIIDVHSNNVSSSSAIFRNHEDKTSDLATKYGLKIECSVPEFYLEKFEVLTAELTIAALGSKAVQLHC